MYQIFYKDNLEDEYIVLSRVWDDLPKLFDTEQEAVDYINSVIDGRVKNWNHGYIKDDEHYISKVKCKIVHIVEDRKVVLNYD